VVTPVVLPFRRALRQISAHKTKHQTRLGQLAAKSQISILGAQGFGVVVEGDVQPDMIASYKPGDFDGPVPQFTGSVRKFDAVAQPAIFRQVK
jgi:hypothetical protein